MKVQELVEKATDARLTAECAEIKWHYIGHLQRNKVKKIALLEKLFCVESVDSASIAAELQKEATKHNRLVNIFVQVNTSGEDRKSIRKLQRELAVKFYLMCFFPTVFSPVF